MLLVVSRFREERAAGASIPAAVELATATAGRTVAFSAMTVAASLAEYINYVCPVPSAQAQIKKDAAKLSGADKSAMEKIADSPLVFPAASDYAKLHYYVSFDSVAEQQTFQKTFEPIVLG